MVAACPGHYAPARGHAQRPADQVLARHRAVASIVPHAAPRVTVPAWEERD